MKNHTIRKVLIANRGEIAVRIIHSLYKLNIKSIAIYAAQDADALHVRMADEAYPLGGDELHSTYLNVEKIISIAKKSGAHAIHPGYGFLSENPVLVEACEKNNILFIGPDAASIKLMGNKIAARKFAVENGLPVTQGITGTTDEILNQAHTLPFPVLVKAAAGGGGKGMRIVKKPDELAGILETTAREAKNYFGDGSVYLEQYIEEPRHIEVQVLGDNYGKVIHLFERECSVQRRYQKIIEESPSPTLTPDVRRKMGEAAVRLCKAIGYRSAGTIEFLVDKQLQFYFLEMNTRIQVEHPVTEMVTGTDLIEEQLRIAMGEPITMEQDQIVQTGHAIECRVYAEDPGKNFMPSPGQISLYVEPMLENVRIDSSMAEATEVHSSFDPMISKLIAWGENREQALQTALEALDEYALHGIKTNMGYLRQIMKHPAFINNQISTNFCDQHTAELIALAEEEREKIDSLLPAAAFLFYSILQQKPEADAASIWQQIGYWRQNMHFEISLDEERMQVELLDYDSQHIHAIINGRDVKPRLLEMGFDYIYIELDEHVFKAFVSETETGEAIISSGGAEFRLRRLDELEKNPQLEGDTGSTEDGGLSAPMPGKVIQVNVKAGDKVKRGTVLLVVEAMKMENNIVSQTDAIVDRVNVKAGDSVDTKTQLVLLKEAE